MRDTMVHRIELDGDNRDYIEYVASTGATVEITDIQAGSERGKGKGRRLIELLLQQLPTEVRTVWAITRVTNLIARQFYTKLGFRQVGVLRGFYADESKEAGLIDAIMFGKTLERPTEPAPATTQPIEQGS